MALVEHSCQLTETGLDINLNYASRSHLSVSSHFCATIDDAESREKERTAAQAASANNRIYKVSNVVCFMLAIGPVHRPSTPRYPRALHRLPSTLPLTVVPPSSRTFANDVYRSWFFISVVRFVTVHFSPIALDPSDWLLIYDQYLSFSQIFFRFPLDKCAQSHFASHAGRINHRDCIEGVCNMFR